MALPKSYLFPALLTYEDGYEIAVTFPDLPGCATSGKNENNALAMAKEALGGHLWAMEQDGDAIPLPTPVRDVRPDANEAVCLVEVYMSAIRMAKETRAVTRAVTLPAWLNAVAQERGVNFSQALQSALIDQLGVSDTRRRADR